MTDSNGHPTTAHVKPKLSGIALGAIALSAAITVLVCYLFVRNTHRQGESVRRAPAELPDTVSPDRAHDAR